VTEEAAREQHDADYRFLVQDVDALNKVRAEKTLSLNLKVRQDERTQLDKERLDRANRRLLAEGQPAVKTVEELDKNEGDTGGDDVDGAPKRSSAAAPSSAPGATTASSAVNTPPDLVLGEAAQVMADILLGATSDQQPPAKPAAQQTVSR
jgi:hypothetical protein